MTSYTITAAPLLAYSLQKMADEANSDRPLDDQGQPIGPEITAEQYLQDRNTTILLDYSRRWCRISIADGIARLTSAEFARIKAARLASQAVDDAVRPIFSSRAVELAGPLWQTGIAALAQAGLLDSPSADRVAALLAPPQPSETTV